MNMSVMSSLPAQSVHALRILRTHGMTAASVHIIFKSVVVAKLVYAASSWWGFATADDRKRLQAVIRRGIRSGLCEQHHKTVEELVEEADDKLFTNVMHNKQHVLHSTIHDTMDTKYHLMEPQLHTPYISSPNHHHLFAAHAHTIAACSAVIPMLCHLHLVSLSAPYLGISLLA